MSKVWKNGDIIEAEDLNNIENGIEEANKTEKTFSVNLKYEFNSDSNSYNALYDSSKPCTIIYSDVMAAITAGKKATLMASVDFSDIIADPNKSNFGWYATNILSPTVVYPFEIEYLEDSTSGTIIWTSASIEHAGSNESNFIPVLSPIDNEPATVEMFWSAVSEEYPNEVSLQNFKLYENSLI